ncbi:protein-glutamate methylesterase/protein-glutamine glutaminase [Tindallia californiensis]|uniref:Protein-glutamate methylesterase/protein-glutamine glutaminase n=1 Tax=Tindallia californiensis TaxID=159292 RepID=A0A1H3NSN7_9FIRM|nr:chemotaxis response regulator protein-glutamate methylesterase [Tindallia californiensis]SDY91189.1 two-component system, chemotaxis family, response regulator CheB [Tindallia californiensis]
MENSSKSIKVLIVDDSSFMRKLFSDMISANPIFEVIGRARNGKEAIEKAEQLRPDVITMDVEMPIMNGIEALKIICQQEKIPVVMVSSLTKEGAYETLKALEYGAVDFIQKPSTSTILNNESFQKNLHSKLKIASKANVKPSLEINNKPLRATVGKYAETLTKKQNNIVAIAISTGGPKALQYVIPQIPATFPYPILIVQHMPPGFTKSLAERLNTTSAVSVKEAENGDVVTPGNVYIAPGDYHMEVEVVNKSHLIKLHQNTAVNGHRPSADPMLRSLLNCNYQEAICVIMTGMGSDGTEGLKDLKKRLKTLAIAQDEKSCVVFGMPKSAIMKGIIDEVVTLEKIAEVIVNRIGGR